MIYPDNFERKIGFHEIRKQIKGRCMSVLGTEWVDNHVQFMTSFEAVQDALECVSDFARFMEEADDVYEENFFDVRQALLKIRPERTYMEELDLFDLKRSLKTVLDLVSFFCKDLPETDEPEDQISVEDPQTTDSPASGNPDETTLGHTPHGNDRPAAEVPYPALTRLANGVKTHPHIISRIDEVLNKYGKVKDTASSELLSVRHTLEVTVRSISHTLRSIISEAQTEGFIERDVTPTLRDGRLVIPVAPALKRKIKGIIHDESATGKTVFIEPAAVVEANNKIRELKAAEKREIIRILQDLTACIRPHSEDILRSLQFLAHMDYLRAAAVWSTANGALVPKLAKHPCIDWKVAKHPLLRQSLEKHGRPIVPLDIQMREGQRILLISGPNAGGKSVCLKTVGLLQYMIQCGLPVPVHPDSIAGIFEDMFIDIGDEQSIEDDLSTYTGHLLHMKYMMKHCGPKSLILIDEFGSGTEPQIGGALAEAILHRFVGQSAFGVITTHYQNLKLYAQQHSSVVNGAMLYDRTRMQPLYLLQTGNPGSSFAIEIARKIGIPEDVIAYASGLVGHDYVMSDKYLQDIVRDKLYWEHKRRNIHQREKQLEDSIASYELEMVTFQKERKAVMAQAKEEAKALLQESNAQIENTIREIREAQAEKERTREARRKLSEFRETALSENEADDRIARKIAKIKRRQERKQRRSEAPNAALGALVNALGQNAREHAPGMAADNPSATTLKAGDHVRMKGQTTVGRIAAVNGKQAKVLFGMIYTTLPLTRLEPAPAPVPDKSTMASTFVSRETREAMHEKKLNFKPEIDLRGMRGDEALTATAYFIDDAIQCEQSRVRILHGTGTGALRQLVRNYLSTTDGVRNFHDEHVQFGGAGITVVELT